MYLNLVSLRQYQHISALHFKDRDNGATPRIFGASDKNDFGGKDGNAKSGEAAAGGMSSGREMGVDIGRVGAWATDFEKLLSDPVGLRTFTVSFGLQQIVIELLITSTSERSPLGNYPTFNV